MTPQILVVGAGPTGLTLACELYRHGVPCRVVDASPGPAPESRALAVHSRSLEVFEDMGVLDAIQGCGLPIHGMNAYSDGKRIVHLTFDELDAPYPYILSIPQSDTERLLVDHLAALGGEVERLVTLQDLSQDREQVTATLQHQDGREETVSAAWVVGCDGAHSHTRKAVGQPFEGEAYEENLLLLDATVDWTLAEDEAHVFFHPDGILGCLPLPEEGLYRLIVQLPHGAGEVEPTLEYFQAAIDSRAPRRFKATLSNPTWLAAFRIHRRMVERYRTDRVFLAGDAAHIHSPVGGQGMNTGIQDAYNLAWKLALVACDLAPESLLDSYHPERHVIAEQVLTNTDRATRAVMIRHPVAQRVRNALGSFLVSLEVVQRRMTRQTSQLAFDYRDSPIVSETRSSLFFADVVATASRETPSVKDWLDFGAAPRPGDRAPDAQVPQPGGETVRVFELLKGTAHTLLLFDGAAPTPEGYANLTAIAADARQTWGDLVQTRVVVPHTARPDDLEPGLDVVLDPEGVFHDRYGAGAECLYLIRPDGHVGFRSQPADGPALKQHLAIILAP